MLASGAGSAATSSGNIRWRRSDEWFVSERPPWCSELDYSLIPGGVKKNMNFLREVLEANLRKKRLASTRQPRGTSGISYPCCSGGIDDIRPTAQ